MIIAWCLHHRFICVNSVACTYLVSRWSLSYNDVAGALDHSHAVGVQQLSVPFAAFAKLELEAAFLVKNLNSMVVSVSNNDIILGINGNAARFGKLPLKDPELSEFAMVHHFLPLDLRFWREATIDCCWSWGHPIGGGHGVATTQRVGSQGRLVTCNSKRGNCIF